MCTVFYHFAVHKLPNFPVQDQLEVCLALLGSLHHSRFSFSSEWLKEHSQLPGFNRSLPKWPPSRSECEIRLILCSKASE